MEYYPDVPLFKLNQNQYTILWHSLLSSPYLYTNGYEIKPASWLTYAFESVKGWFGFENHCQQEKTSYLLNKLAYYGYTQQLQQPDFSLMIRHPWAPLVNKWVMTPNVLSPSIRRLVTDKYNDVTTNKLQTALVQNYLEIQPYLSFDYESQRLNSDHCFGQSFEKIGVFEIIPSLDPQNDFLIKRVILELDSKGISISENSFFKNSKYARAAAQFYLDKAQKIAPPSFLSRLIWSDPRPAYLSQALTYDPDLSKKHVHQFIKHHLSNKNYKEALNLMGLLKDNKEIMTFVLEIPEKERAHFVIKDSSVAAALAQYYVEKKQYSIAQQFYSNIEAISPDAAFTIAIKEQNHMQAYELFQKMESTTKFSMSERKKLAEVFFNSVEREYLQGNTFRRNKNWGEAAPHYLQSLTYIKIAHHLNPKDVDYMEGVSIYKRLYANLLIDTDIDLHPQPEKSDIASIQKAIVLLRECSSKNDESLYYQKTLAKGLMRRVDTLREKIAFDHTPGDTGIKQHKVNHEQELTALIKTLEELISLLKGTKDNDLLLKLGKAHYLLADVQSFFDIDTSDINQHYQMAMDTVPNNPFYTLRVSELFEDKRVERMEKGVKNLKKMGYTTFDFYHWSEERWVKKDSMIYDIKDIHQPAAKAPSSSGWSCGV